MMKAGLTSQELVDLSDFFPTMCEASGIAVPSGLDGHSMVPMFKGEQHAREWSRSHSRR